MGSNVQQTPDDMRGRGNRDHRVVPGLNEHGEGDPSFVGRLYEGAGLGVHEVAQWYENQHDPARKRRWNSLANGHECAGDIKKRGATDFEDNDLGGATGVRSVET